MNGLKKCKQCGNIKSEILFRQYYGKGAQKGTRTGGRYKTCKDCESINGRLKYLLKKETLTDAEQAEVDNTYALYEMERSFGLRPPETDEKKKAVPVSTMVEDQLAAFASRQPVVIEEAAELAEHDIPVELLEWLNKPLAGIDPEVLEESFDKVVDYWRPQLRLGEHGEQIFDDTYRQVLIKIQKRLDDHEDEYYAE